MHMMLLVLELFLLPLSTFDLQCTLSNASRLSIGFLTVASNHEFPGAVV